MSSDEESRTVRRNGSRSRYRVSARRAIRTIPADRGKRPIERKLRNSVLLTFHCHAFILLRRPYRPPRSRRAAAFGVENGKREYLGRNLSAVNGVGSRSNWTPARPFVRRFSGNCGRCNYKIRLYSRRPAHRWIGRWFFLGKATRCIPRTIKLKRNGKWVSDRWKLNGNNGGPCSPPRSRGFSYSY